MKKLVHYDILSDMQKYLKDFNMDDYEPTHILSNTDCSVLWFLRDFYAANLPVDINAWIRVHKPNDDSFFTEKIIDQVCFIRDEICKDLLFQNCENKDSYIPMVVSSYRSGILLPVYQIDIAKHGIKIVLRYDFHDWKISVESKNPIECDFMGLFDTEKEIDRCTCFGLPSNRIYGSFNQDNSQFTIELRNNCQTFTFFFLLNNYLSNKKQNNVKADMAEYGI